MDDQDELLSSEWVIDTPSAGKLKTEEKGVHIYRYLRVTPPSLQPEWDWRVEYNLDLNYLWEATDDVLLIRGHDGGISGHHYDSSLYAVNRQTGELLWDFHAGYMGYSALLDPEEKYITLQTNYNIDTEVAEIRIRHIRISDGEVLWEANLPELDGWRKLVNEHLLMNLSSNDFELNGMFNLWDLRSGKRKWSLEIDNKDEFKLLDSKVSNAYIYMINGLTMKAVDPETGETNWLIEGKNDLEQRQADNPNFENNLSLLDRLFTAPRNDVFQPHNTNQWVRIGSDHLLVDLENGTVNARYEARADESIYAVDQRYWLIGSQEGTSFYDTLTENSLWSIPRELGDNSGATIDGDIMYLLLDNVPTAVRIADGKILWQTSSAKEMINGQRHGTFLVMENLLYLPYGPHLFIINKGDGKLLHRLNDVLIGYIPEHNDLTRDELLNSDGEYLYIGSANGTFSKLSPLVNIGGRE